MVERLFLAVPRGCLQFVIVVFPDHTHLLFLTVFSPGQRYDLMDTHGYNAYLLLFVAFVNLSCLK